jgi:asparagine synthase (glutamine-hydrolysing)
LTNSTIYKMFEIIHHRGPDDEGYILFTQDQKIQTAGGDYNPDEVWKIPTDSYPRENIKHCQNHLSSIALGHKRLSIFDLTPTGHQPMSFGNGRYWIIYKGEIYNYLEIKEELESKDYHFKTSTNSEVIQDSYHEWGVACLNKFVGMWAFALYDHTQKEIFLSRNRYGIKPLYYYFSPSGDFYFGSE